MNTGTRGTRRVGVLAIPAVGLVAMLLLTGCGEDGSIELPSVTASLPTALPSVSVTLPSLTRSPVAPTEEASPEPTEEESPEPTEEASPEPSEEESETPTEAPSETASATPEPTPTRTAVVTETVTPTEPADPTPTASPTPTPSPTASALEPTADDADETGVAPWVWWLLAAAVVAGVVAAVLVPRSRRRAAWAADLSAAEAEAAWFARELLPQLQGAATPDALTGGWQVSAARVTSLEDQLTALEASAPDDPDRTRARQLRDAVRAARQNVDRIVLGGDVESAPRELGAVSAQLTASLRPPEPVAPIGPEG